ncbi:MAG: hypothetical protein EHM70_14060 [Chloroflexota bacterium]|nr:MAG: hypothetical protein EHM70_14060 [Chloroflexota bacterium]
MRKRLTVLLLLLALALSPQMALAQAYYFNLEQLIVHVFWNQDGTASLDYVFQFNNGASASPIEFVDLGLPNSNFDVSSIRADVDGVPVSDISESGFQGIGTSGVAVGLGSQTIPPGESGRVHIFVGKVEDVLFEDPASDDYAIAVFAPAYFTSDITYGTTDLTVIFHLPPGITPDEPRWHESPSGWPQEQPETANDDEGRVTYTWHNPTANASTLYLFGASFPAQYVAPGSIQKEPPAESPFAGVGQIDLSCLFPLFCFGGVALLIIWGVVSEQKRKLQYLPPKIAIEGHGIKRGLTAVEAAILMEQPLDKILTMILFSAIKKNAAEVISRDPLKIKVIEPLPEDLRDYEKDFLTAFQLEKEIERRRGIQDTVINLVKSISEKMKGFSRKETIDYYRSITERAWQQVEESNTPEVKSQKYDEVMEWTMLDKDYGERTRDVFRTGPVFIPPWWGRYDPTFGRGTSGGVRPSPTPSTPSSGSGRSMPVLPGADFAASVVGGVQTFSGRVIGNINDFTGRITQQTNPLPKSTYRSSGSRGGGSGGHCACACACACAGCACACAGGGR